MFRRIPNSTKIAILCLVLGIVAVIFGSNAYQKTKSFVETTATISRVEVEYKTSSRDSSDKSYTVFVNYRLNGKDYRDVQLDYYEDGYEEGKTIPIFYNPQDPSDITGVTLKSAKMLIGVGILVILIGIYVFAKRIITGR